MWFNSLSQNDNSGGFGNIVIVPLMIIINIVLFIGAVIHIGYFFISLKWDDHLKNEVDPPEDPDMPAAYISEEPKELSAKKLQSAFRRCHSSRNNRRSWDMVLQPTQIWLRTAGNCNLHRIILGNISLYCEIS